jgi:hypothetical protein
MQECTNARTQDARMQRCKNAGMHQRTNAAIQECKNAEEQDISRQAFLHFCILHFCILHFCILHFYISTLITAPSQRVAEGEGEPDARLRPL